MLTVTEAPDGSFHGEYALTLEGEDPCGMIELELRKATVDDDGLDEQIRSALAALMTESRTYYIGEADYPTCLPYGTGQAGNAFAVSHDPASDFLYLHQPDYEGNFTPGSEMVRS